MAKLWLAPTGRISKGHVLDCAEKPLLQALRVYDPLLYLRWNPKKLKGWGSWELRRKPETKSVSDIIQWKGHSIVALDFVENNFVSHIKDYAFLNYNILEDVKRMDTWQHSYKGQGFVDHMEYASEKHDERIAAKANEERAYNIKQIRPLIKELKEFVLSGHSPAQIADHWNKARAP